MPKKTLFILLLFFAFVSNTQAQIFDDEDYNSEEELDLQKQRYYDEVYTYAIKHNDSTLLAEAYYLKAKKAQETNIAKSSEYLFKAVQLLKDKGASFELGRLYISLAQNYWSLMMNDKADYYNTLALQTFIICDSERAKVQFAGLFRDFEDPKIQEELYQNENEKYLESILLVSSNNIRKGHYSKAERFAKKALELALKRENNRFIESLSRIVLGKIYLLQNNIIEATNQLNKVDSLKFATFDKSRVFYENYLRFRIDYSLKIKDYEQAYYYANELKIKEISRLQSDNLVELNRLEIDNQTSLKEEEIKSKQREVKLLNTTLKKQKILSVLGLILALSLGGVSIYLFKLNSINKRISSKNKILLNEQNHRVKNNLQFISSLLNLQKKFSEGGLKDDTTIDNILGRIESMSILQRHLYDHGSPSTTDLGGYLDLLIEYTLDNQCDLDVETQLEFDSIEVNSDKCLSIGIIINELCTNSCKYVFDSINHKLKLELMKENENIVINYRDYGSGLTANFYDSNDRGFGIQLIKMQVAQLNGKLKFNTENNLTLTIPNKP